MKVGKLMLVLTNACNLNCIYCYETRKSITHMKFETACSYIDEMLKDNQYHEINIYFFGGEPFLEFELLKNICEWTWNKIGKKSVIFYTITNGTVLNENQKEWLEKNREKLWIVLSLDGSPKSHNLNRSGSFEKIDIDFFKKNWPNAGIKMTLSEVTLPNLYNDIMFIYSKGLKFTECNLAMGINWTDDNNINIFKQQMNKLYHYYVKNPGLEPPNIINKKVGICENPKEIKKICGAWETVFVNTDGKRYPCNYINPMCFNDEELSQLSNIDFTDLESLEDMECYQNCYIYPLCENCYAANYSLNGRVNIRDKSTCVLKKIQAYYSAMLLAEKIKQEDIHNLSNTEKGILHKNIVAIQKIYNLYKEICE